MITLTTKAGIIHVPLPKADDAESIRGNCEHGVSLFNRCADCAWLEAYRSKPLCHRESCCDPSCRLDHQSQQGD